MNADCIICGREFDRHPAAKTCGKECSEVRRLANVRDAQRRWREANPGKARENTRKYYFANRGRSSEYKAEYRQANAEKISEYGRNYYIANRETLMASCRAYRGMRRAAIALGVPPMLYAVMKLKDGTA